MKAICANRPGEDFRLEERSVPHLENDEILVKVDSIAICHTDVLFRNGMLNDSHTFPLIPGHEFSGVVTEIGAEVRGVQVGDAGAVMTIMHCHACEPCRTGFSMRCDYFEELGSTLDGGYAQYCVCKARCFVPIRHKALLSAACLAEPLSNAMAVTRRAQIKRGETVVVIGPGAIGLLACAAARQYKPARVILVGTRDQRLQIGKEHYGVDETVNIRKDGAADYLINTLLGGRGADVVLDCSGSIGGFETALKLLGMYTRIMFEGFVSLKDTIPFSPRLLHQNCSIIGVEGWTEPDFQNAVSMIDEGVIDTRPIMTHFFSLTDWEEAFAVAEHNRTEAIRVIIKPQEA